MRHHPYFLLSDTHREQLSKRLTTVIEQWSESWLAEAARPLTADAEIVHSAELTDTAGQAWRALSINGKVVAWTQFSAGFPEGLLDSAAGSSRTSDVRGTGTALAMRLGLKVYADFVARFLGVDALGIEIAADSEHDTPDPMLFQPGGDAAQMTVRLGQRAARLLVLEETFRTFAPGPQRRVRALPSMTRIQTGISGAGARVRVAINLPDGVAIDELEDLAEGHVILLDQLPSAEWDVLGPDGTRMGRCRPGRVGDRFAVKLV